MVTCDFFWISSSAHHPFHVIIFILPIVEIGNGCVDNSRSMYGDKIYLTSDCYHGDLIMFVMYVCFF